MARSPAPGRCSDILTPGTRCSGHIRVAEVKLQGRVRGCPLEAERRVAEVKSQVRVPGALPGAMPSTVAA